MKYRTIFCNYLHFFTLEIKMYAFGELPSRINIVSIAYSKISAQTLRLPSHLNQYWKFLLWIDLKSPLWLYQAMNYMRHYSLYRHIYFAFSLIIWLYGRSLKQDILAYMQKYKATIRIFAIFLLSRKNLDQRLWQGIMIAARKFMLRSALPSTSSASK